MRILIVGAGASIEEAIRVNAQRDYYPPTMINFAKKLWDSPPLQFFNYWLPYYLNANAIDPTENSTKVFLELEKEPNNQINVERLFEFCWNNRGKLFEDDWKNLMYHGITKPLDFILIKAFFENGKGLKILKAGSLVGKRLYDGDLVLNLNYDTLFEIALKQSQIQFTYIPYKYPGSGVIIAKPHGSLNLLANENTINFAQPDCIGALHSGSNDLRNYNSIVPPRFNKKYSQHPIAQLIIDSIINHTPAIMTFWGVGFTDSDTDILDIYRRWSNSTEKIEVINLSEDVATKIEEYLEKRVIYYPDLEKWCIAN